MHEPGSARELVIPLVTRRAVVVAAEEFERRPGVESAPIRPTEES